MKVFWIGSLVLIIIIIVIFAMLQNIESKDKITNTLTNITDLYAMFTPTMLEFVNSRQTAMNCQPTEYYYYTGETQASTIETQFCLVCKNFDLCYGYVILNRDGNRMMNPSTLSLVGDYTYKDYINLHSYGVAYALNCNCEDEECLCDKGIKATMESVNGSAHETNVFSFPNNLNIDDEIRNIASKMNKDDCQILQNESRIICKDLCAFKLNNNEVIFGIC